MAQINVNHLTFGYDGSVDTIFEDVSFVIDTDWKLGMIGRNGKGKTTFLNLLMGKYAYSGTIAAKTVFDYFPYVVREGRMQLQAADFMEDLKPGCEQWRVICELSELGEDAELLYRPYRLLSPGERTKILLAILFSGENDFLLIDEPTNHLDLMARQKVKEYLASKKGYLLVSHDRDLLDACVDHVLVLNRKTIEVQSGNFSSWWENKQKKDQYAISENEKHRKEIKKIKQAAKRVSDWADKGEATKIGYDPVKENDRSISTRSYIGAKTKKMQSRVKQMEKRISHEIEEQEGLLQDLESPVDLKLVKLTHHKKVLVEMKDYTLQYADAKCPVLNGMNLEIRQGDRVALHGSNGCGKSTLIKMILQKANVRDSFVITEKAVQETDMPRVYESGSCEAASGLIISYISQDTSHIKGNLQDYCSRQNLDYSLFLSILRQLDLERVQFLKNMEDYSEGQKKKVLIASSLLTPAHLYIWDEPLNYIDIFSRMQIEKLILSYEPTFVFVEHDVRFRETVATKIIDSFA